jgi:transposase
VEKMMYAGLDIHKNTIHWTIVDEKGEILESKNFTNHRDELDKFLCNRPIKLVMEACGFWMEHFDYLREKGYQVILAHPMRVEAIASAKMKTDKIDSEILAQLLRCNLIPESWAPSAGIREERELIRFRCQLSKINATLKNRIKSILLKKGVKYRQDIWTLKLKPLLEAQDTKIKAYLAVMGSVQEQMRSADIKIKELNKKDPRANLLTSIYGIGEFAARLLLSEIGEISRFQSAKHLKSYAGIIPSLHQSGLTYKHGHITKQGSKYIRWVLVQCAHVAVRKEGSRFQRFFFKVAQRKGKKIAIVATAAKMLDIIYFLLSTNQVYKE